MSKGHKTPEEVLKEIDEAKSKISPGSTYVHYKGADKIYMVKEFGILEATGELCVIYQAEYGSKLTFIRPVSVWLEEVKWNGKVVPRFKEIR